MKVKLGRNVLGEICSSWLRGWDGCDSNALYCIHIHNSQRMNCVYVCMKVMWRCVLVTTLCPCRKMTTYIWN